MKSLKPSFSRDGPPRLGPDRPTLPRGLLVAAIVALLLLVLLGVQVARRDSARSLPRPAEGRQGAGPEATGRSGPAGVSAERVTFPRVQITERSLPEAGVSDAFLLEYPSRRERRPRREVVGELPGATGAAGAGSAAPDRSAAGGGEGVVAGEGGSEPPAAQGQPEGQAPAGVAPRASVPPVRRPAPTVTVVPPASVPQTDDSAPAEKPRVTPPSSEAVAVYPPPARTPLLAADRVPSRPAAYAEPVAPSDPAASVREGVRNAVEVRVVIDLQGRAQSAVVVGSSGDARRDAWAVQAALKRRYRPPRREGSAERVIWVEVSDRDRATVSGD